MLTSQMNKEKGRTVDGELERLVISCVVLINLPPSGDYFPYV